ncbi:MAG: carboxylating nicotinate-nucleotide diphosphorylase [Actinomycetota bacterium]|nr:carboxylating nicotinate-nucleotide diphosphorylase [Actinomycetota bacterium]
MPFPFSFRLPEEVKNFLRAALREDVGNGDITSGLTIPEDHVSTAVIICKEDDVIVAGLPFAKEIFNLIDPEVRFRRNARDGEPVKKGDVIARAKGLTLSLLASERVALNILQRLSGIATLTRRFAEQLEGTNAKITDTRKTTPNMRYMEKYAVRVGGGVNHRFGLYDGILIKDNHVKAAGGVAKAVKLARRAMHLHKIEIEVEDIKGFEEALDAGADVIMLDNMPPEEAAKAVKLNEEKSRALGRARAVIEASGNITLENVRRMGETGVDLISSGALTHSYKAADLSLEIE